MRLTDQWPTNTSSSGPIWSLMALLVAVLSADSARSQQTVGLFLNEPGAFDGYTLITPALYPSTYLIDTDGQLVHTWVHASPFGASTRLLHDGTLLRTSAAPKAWDVGGFGAGRMEILNWDGSPLWRYDYVSEDYMVHHDVQMMPNGNVLGLVWDIRDRDELVQAGYDLANLTGENVWSERIVEFKPIPPDSAAIVWQWDVWDHLVQDADPLGPNSGNVRDEFFRVDINTARGGDWLHFNAVDYNHELDLIVVSASYLNEFWVIDHSTTLEEARGRTGGRLGLGGDIVYRWGNPQNYRYGGDSTQTLSFLHSTLWIPEELPGGGNLTVFDNGISADPPHSRVLELQLPYYEDLYDGRPYFHIAADNVFGDPEVVWSYASPGRFYSDIMSGQQRLANGNTLIAEGMTGRLFEIEANSGNVVWEYINPVTGAGPLAQGAMIPGFGPPGSLRLQNMVFRAWRYAQDFPGLAGRDLTPKGFIERMPTAIAEEPIPTGPGFLHQNYPNPFTASTRIMLELRESSHVRLTVYNALGQELAVLADGPMAAGTHTLEYSGVHLPPGIYYCRLDAGGHRITRPMLRL
ncbi:MAG: aryl-sulfate sulfotransferase [Bacteroidota bacterium]|nr:aryl-sulfate sulfotransferase [Bacteroidota bacterium]MDE2956714.1 aryl-sulfate sulfotransferase [Bacteroidota bacterium]